MNRSVSCVRNTYVDSRQVNLLGVIRHWQRNWSTRRQLAQLDARELRDIGLSQAEAAQEAARWFWQD